MPRRRMLVSRAALLSANMFVAAPGLAYPGRDLRIVINGLGGDDVAGIQSVFNQLKCRLRDSNRSDITKRSLLNVLFVNVLR